MKVAALFVAEDGPYVGLPNVEPWTVKHDARTYGANHPVVAHPPCERWGRYAKGGPNPKARRFEIGADGGCFLSALEAVRSCGGVLEHPAGSHAFARFNLPKPPKRGWSEPDFYGGRSCRVDQGRYGHPAKKATWLYAKLPFYPELDWEPVFGKKGLELSPDSKEQARAIRSAPGYKPPPRLTKAERVHTPVAFRDLLLGMAATVNLMPDAIGKAHFYNCGKSSCGQAHCGPQREGAGRREGGPCPDQCRHTKCNEASK